MKIVLSYKYSITILAGLACALSLVINGMFWWGVGSDLLSKSLYVVMGCLFDAAKIVCLPLTLLMWRHRHFIKSILSFHLFVGLALVSVMASISVLQAHIDASNQEKLKESDRFQQYEKEITLQIDSIAMLQAVAREDTKNGYRERARGVLS